MSVCGTCHRERLEASRESALGKQVYICGGYEPRTTDLAVFLVTEVGVLRRCFVCSTCVCPCLVLDVTAWLRAGNSHWARVDNHVYACCDVVARDVMCVFLHVLLVGQVVLYGFCV